MTDVAFADLFTFARATSGWRFNAAGLIESISSGNPRFQYDPVTLNKLGLLIEAQRTNICLYSEQFDNANWTKSGSSITANAIVAPDGVTTADKLVESATTANHYVVQGISLSSGVTYTFSFFAKAGERNVISCRGTAAWAADPRVRFTLVGSGSYVVDNGSPTASITPIGNGWYLCSFTATTNAAASNGFWFQIYNDAYSYAGDGTSGLYIWGAQAEAAPYAASYIQTVASQVTRNADSLQITGTDFTDWWNAAAGTYGVTARSSGTSTRPLLSFDDDTTNEQILLRTVGTDLKLTMIDGGVTVADLTIGTIVPDQQFAVAFTFDATGVAASLNGGAPVSDSAITLPTVSRARIGQDKAGNYLGGVIARAVGRPVRVSDGLLRRLAA